MPRGDKSAYTDKQKRQSEHIEEGYEQRGVLEGEAERRAWATVNKETGGGKKSGSGRGKPKDSAPSRKGGKLGGKAAAVRPIAARSEAAKKAAATRRRNASEFSQEADFHVRRPASSQQTSRCRSARLSSQYAFWWTNPLTKVCSRIRKSSHTDQCSM